ncbi:hypothetical protein [Paenibacillus camelliae]|uniref:hypothetical protein n=1 Tax=Paenibacillus camelliae TaxID=512410 RepID=UPI00203D4BAB|nr:hypothetical protein [Paenibacillus camelliae]MCM3633969.1 hypothetical protein [Paenibacillus camelliae]
MRILFVVSRPLEINTSASIRNRATIEGLLEQGHIVELLTTEPDTRHSNHDVSLANKNLKTTYLKLNGIQNVARIGRKYGFLKPVKKIVYTLLSKFEIYDNLKNIVNHVDKIKIDEKAYDLIISSSDPKSSHLFVKKLRERKQIDEIPWIQIWGDPFLSDIARSSKVLNSKIKSEEYKLIEHSTKVVYVSPLTLLEQKKTYPEFSNKMVYVPIPYFERIMYPKISLEKKSLKFLYCGDYSTKIRNIIPLYEAIKGTEHKLVICGNSDLKIEGNENIEVHPRVSYEKVKQFEKECDVLVHLSNISGTQIPGKIYHYSGTNKPILFLLDGEKELLKDTFEKYKRYIFSDNNKESIIDTIQLINKDVYKDYNHIVSEFNAENVAKQIIENQ